MISSLIRRYRFSASHRLHSQELSDEENSRLFGKCNNPFGHGHDYILEVRITGEIDGTTGLVVPIPRLDELVDSQVLKPFSHRNLNQDVYEFTEMVPTTENLALVIADRLMEEWSRDINSPQARLSGIAIEETERNKVEILISQHRNSLLKLREMKEGSTVDA